MSWWSTSWLPSIPSIDFSLPSGIQKRFISFTLRRTLGHLLKPGQLDTQQVDSQIGSGYVQIRDVELDNDAINSMLSGLPIELHDGSLGKVTARIPWPNPLTSTIGLSLESLHLTFNVVPTISKASQSSKLAESIASVAESFIHDELNDYDEAALRESIYSDADLSQSLDHVPGGLDPFMPEQGVGHDLDPSGVSIFATLVERLLARFEFDAKDIKITLVHPGHTSFTLNLPSIRYHTELKEEGSASSSAQVQGVARTVQVSGVNITTRNLRPLSPQPLTSSAASLATYQSSKLPSSATVTPRRSPPRSPALSDSSEMDEDTTMMMSQSIIGLPIRPVSPSSSVASSMYASAISTTPITSEIHHTQASPPRMPTPSPPSPPIRVVTKEIEDETILCFGNEPVVLRLVAPPPVRPAASTTSPKSPTKPQGPDIPRTANKSNFSPESLKLEVSMGVIAVALRPVHVRSILEMAELWTSHSPEVPSQMPRKDPPSPSQGIFSRFDANLRLRSIVAILLPSGDGSTCTKSALTEYYNHPLVPPQLSHGYVRLHLDGISSSLSSSPLPSSITPRHALQYPGTTSTGCFSLNDISVFAFLRSSAHDGPSDLYASPMLITDHHLKSQHSSTHVHPDLSEANAQYPLPTFDVVDWTDQARHTHSAKLSTWRTKPAQGRGPSVPSTPTNKVKELTTSPVTRSPITTSPSRQSPFSKTTILPSGSHTSAAEVFFAVTSAAPTSRSSRAKGKYPESGVEVDVRLAPLHVFCDMSLLLNKYNPERLSEPLLFLEEISLRDTPQTPPSFLDYDWDEELAAEDEDGELEDTPPATPKAQRRHAYREQERDREHERQRLERLVMEDLDLELDYRQTIPEKGEPPFSRVDNWRKKQTRRKKNQAVKICVTLPVLRIEVRTPPPPRFTARSGAIVLDIHDLCLLPGDQAPQHSDISARFTDVGDPLLGQGFSSRSDDTPTLLCANWERLTFAYQPFGESKAQMILSLGIVASAVASDSRSEGIAIGSPHLRVSGVQEPRPQVTVSRSLLKPMSSSSGLVTTALTMDIPSVHVHLGKMEIDGLQLWADDISQLVERAMHPGADLREGDEEDPSLIGSRFFVKSRRSQGSEANSAASTITAPKTSSDSETDIKLTISQVAITIALPRETGIRPFNIVASDIDLLLELRPEGKDETVVTLGVGDLCVRETSSSNTVLVFLSSTTPRNMVNNVQPLLKLRFTSLVVSDSAAKESRIKVTICGATYTLYPNLDWITDITRFVKAPPGVFESVVPSERTRLSIKVVDSSLQGLCPKYPGSLVLHLGEVEYSSVMVGALPETSFTVGLQTVSLLLLDDLSSVDESTSSSNKAAPMSRIGRSSGGVWRRLGYALVAELSGLELAFSKRDDRTPADIRMDIPRGDLRLHLCADTGTALGGFIADFSSIFSSPTETPEPSRPRSQPAVEMKPEQRQKVDLTASLDEHAFRRTIPQVGATPDMVDDDLPTNLDYLDDSFSAAAGLRELNDSELDEFDMDDEMSVNVVDQTGLLSAYGGETIRLFDAKGLQVIENYYETLPPEANDESAQYGETTFKLRSHDCDVTVFLYDGYDWARTRQIIEEEAKEMRRRLAKIRQLVASGQTPDPTVEETNTLLFNSVYIGLQHDVDELEPGALIAAIDEELNEELETASQSSWQSLKPQPTSPKSPEKRLKRAKRSWTRSKGPSIEFRLEGLIAEVDNYRSHESLASRILVTIRDAEILDHIKTSTWSKFLTSLHMDSRGNIRETGSNMVRVELRKVYPVSGNLAQEARLRAKILPLRLHVDQDALDFMKKFFSFKDPDAAPSAPSDPADEIFFQQAEVFPVDLKLDYKPRRVDYRALREGKTIELMNFFHFDGSEMTLRHITLNGITGWARLGDLLNDLWTPDVKATQLVEVISGVAPIRSVVNVGSGVADLVLLPIAQYKKDGRVVRGLQKGTTAFVKSTATEAIKMGARLATGTQVILEQAENIIGGQFDQSVTTEALQFPAGVQGADDGFTEGTDVDDLISRYADQPTGVKDGVKSAYTSMRRNLTSAAQTILAVPMEVYERSGNEGAVRAVVRAVPIAILRPMIGVSEAVSKTLLGLHNTLDPNVRTENEAKYKQR
ncbi:hypothetical protein BDY19DRAFT_1063485 [Irpex rosettiformis]|uniref:Uncharacterized protein n=1 Tax=Irpex rosettiformis TaxID=378272 RepID=A0ACB8UGX5_9APHY|nr:hypothetical protein BDY19DRAFT_1063485 [Irpex rosettiformis]